MTAACSAACIQIHTHVHTPEETTAVLRDDRAIECHIIDSRGRVFFPKTAVGSLHLTGIAILYGAVRRNSWIDNKMLY